MNLRPDIELYWGDCKDELSRVNDETIALVLTDPPYLKEYLYTYQYLADLCPRVMMRGASLVTIVGHYAIPQVTSYFKDKLKYRWCCCMNQFDGPHARMAMGIEVTWKPILWYVKDAYPQGRGFMVDGFKVVGDSGKSKLRHKWQQDESWAEFFVSKLTKEGDTVLDPFMGSGTVGVVCQRLNRNFIGIEIDEDTLTTATMRIYGLET